MALFRREDSTSDMNPQITRWGRLMLIGLGVLILGGLVIGTFIFGSRQSSSPEPATTEQTAPTQSAQDSVVNNAPAPDNGPNQTGQPASLPSQPVANTGPQAVPVTGPQDWIPYIAAALGLLGWQLRRSRKQLGIALRQL